MLIRSETNYIHTDIILLIFFNIENITCNTRIHFIFFKIFHGNGS